ncbi:MAG: tRNA pseudouridine(38-40) synthase TruA [Defluviitaleaceae bacterium]|nr:tRNA pseudouridine(38-40) synthase TruA [Defluviitaleaceae bacterium]
MTVLLTIQYDGTDYSGWQRQSNTPHTVQEVLENALERRLGAFRVITAAGRTDAGVHALAMPCAFVCDNLRIPLDRLPLALNSLLPPDIRVMSARRVGDGFCPIIDATSKTYRYEIDNSPCSDVFARRYAWQIRRELDTAAMRQAAAHFVGTHDFMAFCASGGSAATSVRTIFEINLRETANRVSISVTGSGFLYNMVRIIAGTLADVGLGKLPQERIPAILLSRDRKKAGQTAPANGLTMVGVVYPNVL